jgi:hypothetical protein
MVELRGVQPDGTEVSLGTMVISPKMKAKEIVSTYFGLEGGDLEDMALVCCEELISWMKSVGWTCPANAIK